MRGYALRNSLSDETRGEPTEAQDSGPQEGSAQIGFLRGHDDVVCSASFSPDGQQVVSASLDKTVRVWNADGSSAPIVLRGHDDRVWSASFSPDGQDPASVEYLCFSVVQRSEGTTRH